MRLPKSKNLYLFSALSNEVCFNVASSIRGRSYSIINRLISRAETRSLSLLSCLFYRILLVAVTWRGVMSRFLWRGKIYFMPIYFITHKFYLKNELNHKNHKHALELYYGKPIGNGRKLYKLLLLFLNLVSLCLQILQICLDSLQTQLVIYKY